MRLTQQLACAILGAIRGSSPSRCDRKARLPTLWATTAIDSPGWASTSRSIAGFVRRSTSEYDSPPRYGFSPGLSTNLRCASGNRSLIVPQSSPSHCPTLHSCNSGATPGMTSRRRAIASAVCRARSMALLYTCRMGNCGRNSATAWAWRWPAALSGRSIAFPCRI